MAARSSNFSKTEESEMDYAMFGRRCSHSSFKSVWLACSVLTNYRICMIKTNGFPSPTAYPIVSLFASKTLLWARISTVFTASYFLLVGGCSMMCLTSVR